MLAYIHHSYQQDDKTVSPDMLKMAQFLKEKNLCSEKDIRQLSAQMLKEVETGGNSEKAVFDTVMQSTHSQTMQVLTSIIPEESDVQIFVQDEVNGEFKEWYGQMKAEDRRDPLDIQEDHRMGDFIFRGEQIVPLLDEHHMAPL